MQRLNKFIASSGFCSRRKADEYIENGDVVVNGRIVKELGFQVGPKDKVSVEGKLIKPLKLEYYRFYKPAGYITTSEDDVLVLVKDKKSTPENKALRTERQEQILKAINELKPKFKEVILLCEIEGLSYEECASKIKCPLGTIKSRLYNAKKELAEKLQDLM